MFPHCFISRLVQARKPWKNLWFLWKHSVCQQNNSTIWFLHVSALSLTYELVYDSSLTLWQTGRNTAICLRQTLIWSQRSTYAALCLLLVPPSAPGSWWEAEMSWLKLEVFSLVIDDFLPLLSCNMFHDTRAQRWGQCERHTEHVHACDL